MLLNHTHFSLFLLLNECPNQGLVKIVILINKHMLT